MTDLLALIVTILGALLVLCFIAGVFYVLFRILRDAQRKDKAVDEYRKRFGG